MPMLDLPARTGDPFGPSNDSLPLVWDLLAGGPVCRVCDLPGEDCLCGQDAVCVTEGCDFVTARAGYNLAWACTRCDLVLVTETVLYTPRSAARS